LQIDVIIIIESTSYLNHTFKDIYYIKFKRLAIAFAFKVPSLRG
jgi:hypothetical protein